MNALLVALPYLLGLAVLLTASAFFSGSETALFALTRTQARRMKRGSPGEVRATELLEHPQHLLSTILIANLLVNIAIASIIASVARRMFGDQGVGIAILASSAALLVFGEVTPKTIAAARAQQVARIVAPPLHWISYLLTPFRIALRLASNLVLRMMGVHLTAGWADVTREEIDAMLAMGISSGVTSNKEGKLAERILDLSHLDAHSLMVPRTDIEALDDTMTLAEAYDRLCKIHRSRMPVQQDSPDHIWGFVSLADLPRWRGADAMEQPLNSHRADSSGNGLSTEGPVYPICVVPEEADVQRVLDTMRTEGTQMVILVDEYGGTAGLLTIHDIRAELLGYLSPERETDAATVISEGETFLVDGRTHVRELNRRLEHPLPAGQADTVGGHVTDLMERIPRAGDTVEDEAYEYRVVQMAGRRVGALRLTPKPAPGDDEQEET